MSTHTQIKPVTTMTQEAGGHYYISSSSKDGPGKGLDPVHKSVVVEKPILSSTIEDGALHNSKSQSQHQVNLGGVTVDRIGTQPNPRDSMVGLGKTRPRSGRRGAKKSKKIKKSESQSRHQLGSSNGGAASEMGQGPTGVEKSPSAKIQQAPMSSSKQHNSSKRPAHNRSQLQHGLLANPTGERHADKSMSASKGIQLQGQNLMDLHKNAMHIKKLHFTGRAPMTGQPAGQHIAQGGSQEPLSKQFGHHGVQQ